MTTAIRSLPLVFTTFVLLGAVAPTTRAETFPTVSYRLIDPSTYQEGCFDPCDCPIVQEQTLSGTFDLVFYPFEGPLWTVGIQNVDWIVPALGKRISGQGTYVLAGDMQQLRLELQIDDQTVRTFDSGWVTGGSSYPTIDVTVSMNGLRCYDIALHVRAAPDVVVAPNRPVGASELACTAKPEVSGD